MTISEKLLLPFQKFFKPPTINTPFSTIKMPSTIITVSLVFASYFVIVGGFIFCYVNGMPMTGYSRNEKGQIIHTWFSQGGLSNQYLGEGIICSIIFSLGAASMIAGYYAICHQQDKDNEIVKIAEFFGCTTLIWAFIGFKLFNMKIPSYFPYLWL